MAQPVSFNIRGERGVNVVDRSQIRILSLQYTRKFYQKSVGPQGRLKGKAYANKPRTIQEMENNIRREIAAISEDVLQATFANISSISSSIDMLLMKQGM